MKKIISAQEAISFIKEGSTVMVGGFLECGAPDILVDELVNQNIGNLTMISNDTTYPHADKGKLIVNKQIKKLITSHIGTNPETGKQMHSGELDVELVPMGTLIEKIRAKGTGLGGVLTPTGVGTVLEENKKTMEIDGKTFIFEKPLGADFALIYGTKVDKFGNVSYYGTTRNLNTIMATAADTVIVQADELVDCLDPNEVVIPGLFVDYIVVKEDN
ncbi:MAG: CoA transferase subunit A [Candidatus Gastranaerophilaceae bacterium]|jgi:3-oxoacid coA-transferase, A subunit|uniref:CoA transferase subunit A n=1 Tax=Candidatus Limenecus avicola TaxID=2840847 RepID=A0A9D1MYL7_9CLOT|nr:CoA transferase subunit A [Clostridium sp.]CDC21860.1 3-oxoacid CoA-transferase A subunit [Clostridium sp. CAG:306]DAB23978.1 MAG TPA: CoA transferase subunit A [Candidatus Gastranaerophilales bacterium HUM_21]HIU91877.1 CoA transferase subunit A [Candidatus Limenecus avicola]